ncbi:MAG: hypothetical protein GF405_09055 [Candidatus Eisenbacteria bacterium]|nr:hypothetical protein [Candidatus Eisenbacteria bacterium]
MDEAALLAVAADGAAFAALHHLLFILGAIFLWLRRDLGRAPSILCAAAFATSAWLLLRSTDTRIMGVAAVVLASVWVLEAVRPRSDLSFTGAPKVRVAVSLATFIYALVYPGYGIDLPLLLFAPLGVLVPPTTLAALSVLNVSSPRVRPWAHWAHVAAGLIFGLWGLALGQWGQAPLVAASLYGAALLLRGSSRVENGSGPEGKVKDIRDRMYSRKTLLPGPRKYGRRINVGRRRKTGGRR